MKIINFINYKKILFIAVPAVIFSYITFNIFQVQRIKVSVNKPTKIQNGVVPSLADASNNVKLPFGDSDFKTPEGKRKIRQFIADTQSNYESKSSAQLNKLRQKTGV